MLTRFYDQPLLEGNYIDLNYGSYTQAMLNAVITSIQSINVPPHVMVTLFRVDNFSGQSYVVTNNNTRYLKVVSLTNVFNFPVASLKIECACDLNLNSNVDIQITQADFTRNGNLIAYSFYNVIPEPLQNPLDKPSPFNPTIFIIPDFGTDKSIYACLQDKFAQKRFSSIVLDLRGVGLSYSAQSTTYADIIQDYRTIAQTLNQYVKKPILIGHGYGGAIAQLWALTYKFELRDLILIDTAPYAVYSTYNLLLPSINQWLANTLTISQLATIIANATYNTSSSECQPAVTIQDLERSFNASDAPTLQLFITQNPDIPSLADAPKFILIRTLIIYGLADAYIKETGSLKLKSLIGKAHVRKINTGHSPQFTEPQKTIDSIMNFLSPKGKLFI